MRFFLFAVLLGVLCPLAVFSQEFGYTHYESKDGLPGSTVYCMTQDKEGFLWLGTDIGLSRFDGTHFKNFTKEDGLPDNEIIQLFADSKGRIWIAPFKKSVCYYYKGKIYTQNNDPVLKRIHLDDYVIRFAEDKAGNILMQETKKLHLVHVNGNVTIIDSINSKPIVFINTISAGADGAFRVIESFNVYDYKNDRFQLRKTIPAYANHFSYFAMTPKSLVWISDRTTTSVTSVGQDRTVTYPVREKHVNYGFIDETHVGACTMDGVVLYDLNRPGSTQNLLPGIPVSNIFKDTEGNVWFPTLGHGVYRLSSPFVTNYKLRNNNLPVQVFAFARYGESMLASTELNILYRLNRKTGKPERERIMIRGGVTMVGALSTYKDKYIFGGTNYQLLKLGSSGFNAYVELPHIVVKSLFQHGDKLYVATKDNVFVVNPETFTITDTIWHERSTSVFVSNDTTYIGTLSGLYFRLPDGSIQFPGEKMPALSTRITAIQKDAAGVLWVGTYGDGIIGYKNGRVVATINRNRGLTSNVCRTMFINGNALWVGTDKGINKINVARPGYPVTKYTTGDGLASDIINAVYVDGNNVYVGTPEGITFFDEEKVISESRCDLRMVDVTVGDETFYPTEAPVIIPHAKNSIRFNYAGISFKSNGDIRYRYRLLGLDSAWKETRETFLSYPTLPSGEYQLQLQAINKFDVASQVLATGFTIEKLLYEKTGFRVLIGLLFLAVTGATVLLIIRRIRKREREKTKISKRINELEQLSRKAQMNPHFIFNSLNSIQQYVMDADVAGANKFISGFSRLIRQTLDFSSKPEISLEEELDYLTNYLEIEKTRLENAFTWSVAIDKTVDPAEYYIPPMILQPFVENSVRHGLRFRKDKAGKVTITVKREGDYLICILDDNGVGRKAAMQYKSISPINYQSKGLSLTADRISMFNQEHDRKITMHIDDLEDDIHNSLGTRVTISFPVF
ncbi:MAG TPA: two-component regulator propeller domain-containing protein [Niastella sp.]